MATSTCAPAASSAFVAGTGKFSELTRPTVNGTRVPDVGSTTPVVTTAVIYGVLALVATLPGAVVLVMSRRHVDVNTPEEVAHV